VRAVLKTNVPKARWVEIEAAPLGADYALRSSDDKYIAILKYTGAQPENSVWVMTLGLADSVRALSNVSPPPPAPDSAAVQNPSPTPFVTASPSAPAKYISTDRTFLMARAISLLVWLPLGFVIGLFVTAQIALPLILGLPRAMRLVSRGEMRSAVYARLLITPILWVVILFLIGFFWPAAAAWVAGNAALNVGIWLGTIGILLSPLSKKSRSDFRDDFDRSYGQFYIGLGAFKAFGTASDAYDSALKGIETHTTRANHRFSILDAKRALLKPSEEDFADAAAAYDEVIAAYNDPTDHEPYSEADLHAHTIAMDALSAAFGRVKSAFGALNNAADLYPSTAALYKAHCDIHVFATRAYSYAADCAMTSALEAQLQNVKDEWNLMLLEAEAAYAAEVGAAGAVAIRNKAATFKATLADNIAKANSLQEEAKIAEAKAEAVLTQAQSAQANIEEILDNAAENA
jgi:hypothetical protein